MSDAPGSAPSDIQLDTPGRKLLQYLVGHLASTKPGRMPTSVAYKGVCDVLGLTLSGRTYGEALQQHGLSSLADWTEREGHPAITGLIVDKTTGLPGPGYFKLLGKSAEDFSWWQDEVRKSLTYDWSPYLNNSAQREWTDEELRAAVTAYIDMARHERDGTPFNKRSLYGDLAQRFGRSPKAFEYRMQNISYVLSIMGRDCLNGLKPAKNVGERNAARIEALIGEIETPPRSTHGAL